MYACRELWQRRLREKGQDAQSHKGEKTAVFHPERCRLSFTANELEHGEQGQEV